MGAMRTGVLLVGLALTLSLATAAAAQPLSGPEYIALATPCRALDTRLTGTPLSANVPTTIRIGEMTTGGVDCGVPLTAVAAALNFTITEPQGRGHMVAWPSGDFPATSVVNFDPGEDVANAVDIGLGAGGTVLVQSIVATHLVVDIYGYFTDVEELGNGNTALGDRALVSNTTGASNTALGAGALGSNTTGNFNTATGAGALESNTTGGGNTATGTAPSAATPWATATPPLGSAPSSTTSRASATPPLGAGALGSNTTGNNNTATGVAALFSNTTGTTIPPRGSAPSASTARATATPPRGSKPSAATP